MFLVASGPRWAASYQERSMIMPLQACDLHEDFVPVFSDEVSCPACAIDGKLEISQERISGLEQEIRDMATSH